MMLGCEQPLPLHCSGCYNTCWRRPAAMWSVRALGSYLEIFYSEGSFIEDCCAFPCGNTFQM